MNIPNDLVVFLESPIIRQVENVKTKKSGKVIFEAILQTADDINKNKKRYRNEVLKKAIAADGVREKMKIGRFYGETDHPITENIARLISVLWKDTSHRINELWMDGKYVRGLVENVKSCPNGKMMYDLIEEKMPIGFSLRGLGKCANVDGIQDVVGPVQIITYDSVTNPSHVESRVVFLKEHESEVSKLVSGDTVPLIESAIRSLDDEHVAMDGSIYLKRYLAETYFKKFGKFCKLLEQ